MNNQWLISWYFQPIIFSDVAGLGSPYFPRGGGGGGGMVNVTTQLESTTYLNCYVNRLGGKTVGPTSYTDIYGQT